MGTRKKAKKSSKAKARASGSANLDLRASKEELPFRADTAEVVIDHDGIKARAVKSLRDAPLDRMYVRKQIDDGQYAAGDYMRAMFELFGADGVRAMDFSKPVVDSSGGGAIGVTDAQLRAAKRLRVAREYLGVSKFKLLIAVVAQRKFIEELAGEGASQREKDFLARTFRECLAECGQLFLEVRGANRPRVGDSHAKFAHSANKPELHRALVSALDAGRLAQQAESQTAGRVPVTRAKLLLPPGEAA